MSGRPHDYVPAAGRDWLLPFYDPLVGLLLPEQRVRRAFLDAARIADPGRAKGYEQRLSKLGVTDRSRVP